MHAPLAIILTVLAGFLGLVPAAVAGSQYVIIATEPASAGLEPGRVLKLAETLAVPDGITVTLLGEDGTVSAIPGPANVTVTDDGVGAGPSEEKRSALSKLAGLLAGENKSAQSLGVARSVGDGSGDKAKTDPWAIPSERDGNGCARAGTVTIARENGRLAQAIAVDVAGKTAAELTWPAGENLLALPQAVGGAEEFEIRASGKRILVQLHRLPGEIAESDTLGVLGWMIDQGCDRQAIAFSRHLAQAAK